MSTNSNFSKFNVDAASAFTAVCVYHPWRTLATRTMAGMPFTISPKHLYAGFFSSMAAAHQLFVISYVYHLTSSEDGSVVSAATAGAASAPTATVFEARACRKQLNISVTAKSMAVVFRGFAPMVFRQVGLAFGMFVIPSWVERKCSPFAPAAHQETSCKVAYSLMGSIIAALFTHYPDTVRVVMQSQQELTMRDACRIAFTRMMSRPGAITCVMRVSVLAIAFTTMRLGKKYFPTILNKQESES